MQKQLDIKKDIKKKITAKEAPSLASSSGGAVADPYFYGFDRDTLLAFRKERADAKPEPSLPIQPDCEGSPLTPIVATWSDGSTRTMINITQGQLATWLKGPLMQGLGGVKFATLNLRHLR